MPLVLSWSALRTWEECRQKHKLTQTGKKNPAQDIRGYFHGTVVDRCMRAWLNDDDQKPGEMAAMVEDMIDACALEAINTGDGVVRWKNRDDRQSMTAYCKELLTRLEPILYELVIPYDYQPELRFKTPIKLPYLNGQPTTVFLAGGIDIVVRRSEDPPIWCAYDLKGTQDDSYYKKVIGQGIFYDISIGHMFGSHCTEFALIQPMCKQRIVPVKITDDDRRNMMTRLERMAHAMWQKDWAPKEDTKGCDRCEVRHACTKFTPVQRGKMALGGKP